MQNQLFKKHEVGVFALGGLGEVGKNMYVVEYQDEIIIIDSGVKFPDENLPGIDYVIPDYTYLQENQDKIKALVITHGHEDHIGGIPWLLRHVKIPKIYATGLAAGLIRKKMEEHKALHYNLLEFFENDIIRFKQVSVGFFRTNHSIPDSFGVVVKTPRGKIVHTGDFKFDFTPTGPDADYAKMAKLGSTGVLLLLSDSTGAEVESFTKSETTVSENIKDIFSRIEGRAVVATFASNLHRVQQVVEASIATNRKIAVFGRSMERTVEVGQEMGYIKAPHGTFVSSKALKHFEPEEITILSTGSQGEPFAALSRIANGTHRQIKIQKGDTVIFSSSAIPGNQKSINNTINNLFKQGANVITHSPLTDIHSSGHAGNQELRLMLKLMKPKYFMPIHGEHRMLKIHAETAEEVGVPKENSFICDIGDVVALTENSARKAGKVPAGTVYIDGKGIGDIGSVVLKDRRILGEDGLLSAIISINKDTRKLFDRPVIVSRGFIYMKDNQPLTNEMSKMIADKVKEILNKDDSINVSTIKRETVKLLNKYIYSKTERNPMILPVVSVL
ncbi:MAG: ribonuclease J1 [Candidatus Izemoplasmataceae bacterium]